MRALSADWRLVGPSLWAIILLSGCAADGFNTNWFSAKKHNFPTADEKNPVVRILAMWEPGEGIGHDNRHRRGFAGRIYFFTRDSEKPVAINGDVRIYLFDDQGPVEEHTKPIHQFDFVDGAWHNYLRDTKLGPAYDVFVPYPRDSQQRAECALCVRLVPKSDSKKSGADDKPAAAGPVVHSKLAHVTLFGAADSAQQMASSERRPQAEPADRPSAAQQDLFQARLDDLIEKRRRSQTIGTYRHSSEAGALQPVRHEELPADPPVRTAAAQVETDAAPTDPALAARLDRLEQLLQATLEDRGSGESAPSEPISRRPAPRDSMREQPTRPSYRPRSFPGRAPQPAASSDRFEPLPEWDGSSARRDASAADHRYRLTPGGRSRRSPAELFEPHPLEEAGRNRQFNGSRRQPERRHQPLYRDFSDRRLPFDQPSIFDKANQVRDEKPTRSIWKPQRREFQPLNSDGYVQEPFEQESFEQERFEQESFEPDQERQPRQSNTFQLQPRERTSFQSHSIPLRR